MFYVAVNRFPLAMAVLFDYSPQCHRGGIEGCNQKVQPSPREIYLLQRKTSKIGSGLGKTTGWIHRAGLAKKQVKMINGCHYERIDDQGLHMRINDQLEILAVDNIVICAQITILSTAKISNWSLILICKP